MMYKSTRDTQLSPRLISSAETIKTGLAPDGGLFVPDTIPEISPDYITKLCTLDYRQRAAEILSLFLDDYDKAALAADCSEAYSDERFPGGAAPLHELYGEIHMLELWHGPTCAFKDMALQIMPRLLSRSLKMTGETRRAHILVATSGDTGKAALEGYRDVDGIDITVFFPVDGVSQMQKLQMTTQEGENVRVCAVRGNFDDAQNGVKAIFSNLEYAADADRRGYFFSSANSINWGRLAPQIVYYISAYCDLIVSGKIKPGDKINICVPTGNFGNIFASYIAYRMGLPVKKFICASNSNCVLTDFINTGIYDRTREFFTTMSPSMDILISSNLERLLYTLSTSAVCADCMKKLASEGRYTPPDYLMDALRTSFSGFYLTENETAKIISYTFSNEGYLVDPHSAVALGSAYKYKAATGDTTPIVVASTASPYKFARDVLCCLGKESRGEPAEILKALESATGTECPLPLQRTLSLPVRFENVVAPDKMADFVFSNM